MGKINVAVEFIQSVPFRKTIEMDSQEFIDLAAKLDSSSGRERRRVEEEIFGRCMFTADDADFGQSDPELEVFDVDTP